MRPRCAATPSSAFGGIVALNGRLDAETATAIAAIFTEVIVAPEADEEAVAILATKKNLRLLLTGTLPDPRAKGLLVKPVGGGFLVQERDGAVVGDLVLRTVTKRAPDARELADLRFAFTVAKHVKSNAIVYARHGATVGIGAGQMSRLDSSRHGGDEGAGGGRGCRTCGLARAGFGGGVRRILSLCGWPRCGG